MPLPRLIRAGRGPPLSGCGLGVPTPPLLRGALALRGADSRTAKMTRHPRAPLLPLVACLVACSSAEDPAPHDGSSGGAGPAGTGGLVAGGGDVTGGVAPVAGSPSLGGAASGGARASGGFAAGGVTTGGQAPFGGTGSGGEPSGGVSLGGASSGGTETGGVSSGGAVTGGVGTGGTATGGSATGGAVTGGVGTGGVGGDCSGPLPGTSGTNPLFTDRFTADPAAFVHDCTFYVACGHDEGTTGFVMRDWYILSSTDMVHWSDNGGPALRLTDFAWANANAWAGHVTPREGKFYWYVPINELGGAMTIAVAVADSPTGPYRDALGGPLVSDSIEMANWGFTDAGQTPYTIDPAVFIDDDGQAYLYYGGFWRLVGGRLGADMISLEGSLSELRISGAPSDGRFWEAPYMVKRDGTYYMIYAAGQNPATIDYATAADPLGPFTYRGRVLGQLPNLPGQDAATNHAGAAEFLGQWYLVYHLSDGPNGGTYRRQVAVDKLSFGSDGGIVGVAPSGGLQF